VSIEDLAREYLDAVNNRDWDRVREVLHPEYTYADGTGEVRHGPDAAVQVSQGFVAALPDAKVTIERMYASGDTVIVEFTGTGTHDGDFQGIAPTGNNVRMPICLVLETRDGKIIAEREYMDMAHLLQQIGVVPAPATA
jgi:steroid delta-isomerase-like uncharacterized protein